VAASNSPVSVMLRNDAASLLESTTTALEAATVPAVIPSSISSSASVNSAPEPNVSVPVTVRLSFTVTSEVVWPIEIGTPDVAVPIVIPFEVLELSIFNEVVASNEIVVPSTASVPSISVLSKLEVPSTSISPATSKPAAPAKTKSSADVSQSM